ncbi:MAG: ABC transporter permease subunit [Clostridia bacterium]|nr:ABC transporter permease subunit [Clostridia bacterium]
MKRLNKVLNLILPLFTIGTLIVAWAVAARINDNEYILPSVTKTASEFFTLFSTSRFYLSLALTVMRSLIAFILSFIISAVLAYSASKSRVAERLILPFVSIVRALPTIAIAWLLLFWTNNQIAPVVITMLVVMPTSYTHIKGAIDGVNKITLEAAMVDGAGRKELFFKIELPQIAPDLCSITGSGIALNFKLMVAAEVLSTTVKSLGTMLNMASYSFEVATILALTVVVLILGLIVEFIFNALSKKAGEWK